MLINLRNALMAGKRLPYDAEVEYLESTGTQYIDTGIVQKSEPRCVFEFQFTTSGQDVDVVGNNVSKAGCYIFDITTGNGNFNQVYYRYGSSSAVSTSAQGSSLAWKKVDAGSTLTVNGVALTSIATFDFSSNTQSIWIFRGRTYAKIRMKAIQIYDGGVLKGDFIPVRKGTVGYLYDRVSGKLFGNAGTGDFVLGPDVVPVEYLQGCLGGYVDTGIKSLNTISADISFGVVNPTHDSVTGIGLLLYGNGTTWAFDSYAIFFQNTLNQPDYKSLSSHGHNNILVQTPQNSFDCNVGVACDGTSNATVTTTYNGTTTSRSISISAIDGTKNFILLWNRNLDDNTVITRLKSAEFISGGATIAKFVPVRVGTDATTWEGAMMDTITRRIYRNAGSGAFGYGNDLRYPIPAE